MSLSYRFTPLDDAYALLLDRERGVLIDQVNSMRLPVTMLFHQYQQHQYRRIGHNGVLKIRGQVREGSRADRHRLAA